MELRGACKMNNKTKKHLSRKMRHGGYATAMIVAVIAVVVVLNIIVGILADMYSLTLDLTTGQTYALSDEVKPYVQQNDKDVQVYVLSDEVNMAGYTQLVQLNAMLKEFVQLSDKLTLTYVDIVKDPTFVANYPDLELASYDVLFDCDGKTKVMTLDDMFTAQQDQTTGAVTYTSNVEQKLLSALITVTAETSSNVAFLGGHDETAPEALVDLLKNNNYTVKQNENLSIGLSEDFDALIICAPARDYSAEELKVLSDYLSNNDQLGKNVFYFASPSQPELPNLEEFLLEWGIDIGPGVAMESDANRMYYQNPYYPIATYQDPEDKYSGIFSSRDVNLVTPLSREMKPAFSEDGTRSTVTLLQLSEKSYITPKDEIISFDNAQTKGSIPVAIVGDRAMYNNEDEYVRSDVIAVASIEMLNASLLNNSSVLNGDYIINLFNRTLQSYELVYITAKDFNTQAINITSGQANTIGIVFAVGLPVVVLVCGLGVFLRRRHL